jgi:hypothetical protein
MSTLGIVAAVKARGDDWQCALEGFLCRPKTRGKLTAYDATRENISPDTNDFYEMRYFMKYPKFSLRRCATEVR